MRLAVLFIALSGGAACAPSRAGTPAGSPPSSAATKEPVAQSEQESGTTASGRASGAGSPHPLLDDRSPDPAHGLPRLNVKHIGLHVGGGTGSSEEREGLLGSLEAKQVGFMACYKLVDRPEAGGTFGADLFVPAKGGHPEVRAVRHKLGGGEFESCMTEALTSASFGPQARALVVSYSLRFELSL